MAIWRMQCSFQLDTTFPRDKVMITPHFKDTLGSDVQGLCDDLAAELDTWTGSFTGEIAVKAYDAESPPPNLPAATKILYPGVQNPSTTAREVALCLSYFSGTNTPSKRGRLYLPAQFCTSSLGKVPDGAALTKAAALVPILTGLGGVDVDWVVWSRKNASAHSVTNWFVDNEWDVIRSRGLRATTRTEGTASE